MDDEVSLGFLIKAIGSLIIKKWLNVFCLYLWHNWPGKTKMATPICWICQKVEKFILAIELSKNKKLSFGGARYIYYLITGNSFALIDTSMAMQNVLVTGSMQ